MIQSPLNYTGGKYKLLPQILPHFPNKINTFIDLFCGGCNVGINISANKYFYNDICFPLIELFNTMKNISKEDFISQLEEIISYYHLSDSKKNGYEFYRGNNSKGLAEYNKINFLNLRADYNKGNWKFSKQILLYALIVFSFNNQIRFNNKKEFNLPVGKRDFNQRMYNKLNNFIDIIQKQEASFSCVDFKGFSFDNLGEEDLIYVDPPYLITCASYNEKNGWTEQDEKDLLKLLDKLHSQNTKFILSNVIETKGKENIILLDWINFHPDYKMIPLDYSYKNSNYHRQNKELISKEILIKNF